MSGVYVKGTDTPGVWKRTIAGSTGVSSIIYRRTGGVWRVHNAGLTAAIYVKMAGVWEPEVVSSPPGEVP